MAPMDHSGFLLSSAHRTREQDTCTNIPNEILHDSAARAKYIRARMTEFVRPQSLLWLVKWVNAHSLIDRIGPLFYWLIQSVKQ